MEICRNPVFALLSPAAENSARQGVSVFQIWLFAPCATGNAVRSVRKLKIDGRSVLLVRGRVAKIYYSARSPCAPSGKVFRFWRLVDGREKSTWHTLEELDEIQAAAREMNAAADRVGTRFAVPTESERAALVLWRKFCRERETPPRRNFVQILADALSREIEMDETPKIEDAAASFLEWKRGNEALSASYRERVARQLGFFVEAFKGKRLAEIGVDAVEAALAAKNCAVKTRRHYLAEIREMFAWHFRRANATRRPAEKQANPLELLELPSVPKSAEPEILTPDAGTRFFAEAERERADFAAICALCAFCGVRLAEAMRLRWRDVREHEIFLACAITKTKIARVALVPANAAMWLARARGNADAYVFGEGASGEMARQQAFNKMKVSASARAGVSIPRNAFRHTAVSALSRVYGHAAAADACGHDVRTQGVFYRAAMSEADARAWLSIAPAPCEHGFPRETGEISVPERKDEGEPAPDAPAASCAP